VGEHSLQATAAAMLQPGKGILAAERTSTPWRAGHTRGPVTFSYH
jgi:hypothetical protein